METTLAELVYESNARVLSYDSIARGLGVRAEDVEVSVLQALDTGAVSGRLDAEREQLVIDGAAPPAVTRDRVRQALAGLDQIEAELTSELDTRKRSHNALDEPPTATAPGAD